MADITILNLKIAKTYLAFTAIKFDLLHHKKPWFEKYFPHWDKEEVCCRVISLNQTNQVTR